MSELRLTGLGTYLPQATLDNRALPALEPPMSEEDMARIGVHSRGVASDQEGVLEMAVTAAQRALAEGEMAADALDFILLSNWTERRYAPDFAPRIQHRLGAKRAFAFDLCCACCGFVYGLSIADGYLKSPRYRRGLVIASDRSTRLVRPRSRGTLIFGDGAAAALVERDVVRGARLLDYELCSDGSMNELMSVGSDGYLHSHARQREVNELAVRSIDAVARSLLRRNQLDWNDLDWVVPHSGTPGIQGMLADQLGAPRDKVLTNLPVVGNVVSASIPVALRQFKDAGTLQVGDLVLVVAVGLGWQYAAALLSL